MHRKQPAGLLVSHAPSDFSATVIVFSGLTMNACLAVSNNFLFPMTVTLVTAVQFLITLAAVACIAVKKPAIPAGWVLTGIVIAILAATQALLHGINPKQIYDLLVIPIFILLGMTFYAFPIRFFLSSYACVWGVTILDVFFTPFYGAIFNPLLYFLRTRAWVADNAGGTDAEVGLYIGAERGGGMFFSFLTDHRAGSIFLEPLNLGYFAVLSSMIFAIWLQNRFYLRASLMFSCAILALFTDSRISTALIFLFFILSCIREHLPRWLSLTVVPAIFLVLVTQYITVDPRFSTAEIVYRVSITFDVFANTPFAEMMVGSFYVPTFADSGILYLIYTATLPGMFVLLYFYGGNLIGSFQRYPLAPIMTTTYITVAAFFGGAFLSIKTVTLLGLFVGTVAMGRMPISRPSKDAAFRNEHLTASLLPK